MGIGLSALSGLLSSETAVGVSIGSSSIKIVELKKQGKQWKLLHFGIAQLPEETIVNREIASAVPVVNCLKSLSDQIHLKTKNVCSSLSGPSVIIKRFQLDIPNKKELQDQVFWEAEQYLPFDVAEVVMDFQVVSQGKDGKTDVILVAVKRAVLESYMGTIEDAGLKSKVMDTDYFALQHVFEANYPAKATEAVAVVDIGAAAMKMVVVHNGIPLFTKDASLGGRQLTQEIQKTLNIPFADAESLKVGGKSAGVPADVSEVISIAVENYATEIRRALDFYSASALGPAVAYLLLTGGGSKVSDLSRVIEEKVGLPTQMMNPFNMITYDPAVFTPDYIAAIAPVAAVPLGLAIRAGSK